MLLCQKSYIPKYKPSKHVETSSCMHHERCFEKETKSKYKIIFLLNIEQNNFSHHSSTVSAGTCLQPASLATNPGSRLHPNGGCASRIIEITKRFLLYTLGGSKSLFIHRFLLYRLGGSKSWFICFGCPDLVGPSSGSYAGLCYRLGGSKSQFICTLM